MVTYRQPSLKNYSLILLLNEVLSSVFNQLILHQLKYGSEMITNVGNIIMKYCTLKKLLLMLCMCIYTMGVGYAAFPPDAIELDGNV